MSWQLAPTLEAERAGLWLDGEGVVVGEGQGEDQRQGREGREGHGQRGRPVIQGPRTHKGAHTGQKMPVDHSLTGHPPRPPLWLAGQGLGVCVWCALIVSCVRTCRCR
jgi:hypothetical protein